MEQGIQKKEEFHLRLTSYSVKLVNVTRGIEKKMRTDRQRMFKNNYETMQKELDFNYFPDNLNETLKNNWEK